ncbi:PASTA domain-containing protein [Pseudonocardia ammonioxydans]|uniref:PASTA domain-containing protein n=1 Tax=Pseudonocardia ammonioxydans TaxID=260086 RepID=A0A1I5HKY2_PSUAM|nr:PASTA domain-containing protein [Pseudonocardia ammonioxydans]SFO48962.1 PASTA domain-containing protein [Pseudonocardia ammonioxydans]
MHTNQSRRTDTDDRATENMITVPELVGLPAAEAHDRALDAGLLAVGRNAAHTGAGRGHVVEQEPTAGRSRERGGEVGIWIAAGSGPAASGADPDDPQDPGGDGGGNTRPEPSPVHPAGGGVKN